ncbi:2-oxoacid:acceptor oxidoreductase family protein [Patescibacteria group bacterium]
MSNIYQIRIHARAGQGAKSAAHFIAEAAFAESKQVQAFPSYGPERTGAPMQAFVRLSDEPIRIHYGIAKPDTVIVIDPTLLENEDVTAGLKSDGFLIVNTPETSIDIDFSGQIITVDASGVATEILGKNLPNTAMIAAAAKAAGFVDLEKLKEITREFFTGKYNAEIGEKNVKIMDQV